MASPYRLFAWNLSYFSAKVRTYLRYKAYHSEFQYTEIMASQEIINDYIIPATGSNVVPQIQDSNGNWLQDSSEIIDTLEERHPGTPVVPTSPRQRLVSYIIELLADEWLLPWGFWERWHYSQKGIEPNHEAYNAQQWGRIFNPAASGLERREAGRFIFREIMKIDNPEEAEMGPFAGLPQLGVTDKTQAAWTDSLHNILNLLEAHFDQHNYILGGQPSLADFALMGPLYPHLYRDPVPGFMMRSQYPLICEWIERVNGSQEAGSCSYQETTYALQDGGLVAQEAGEILPNDEVPETLLPLLGVFFDEMWPVLQSNISKLNTYLQSAQHKTGAELPGKSFYSPVQFSALQSKGGSLSHEFTLGGVTEWRMVSPYQVWMLQRLTDAMADNLANEQQKASITALIQPFTGASDFLDLPQQLASCRIRKQFEQLFAQTD